MSVSLLHAGIPTSLSLMFSFIDNEIEHSCVCACDCCIIWNCCVTRVNEHLQFIACMFRDIIVVMSATIFSGAVESKIINDDLRLVLAVIQLARRVWRDKLAIVSP